jgi:isochorismate hydrolase
MAGNLDFRTYLVSDATATFDRVGPDGVVYTAEEVHAISLASLHGGSATVVDTDSLLQLLWGHGKEDASGSSQHGTLAAGGEPS